MCGLCGGIQGNALDVSVQWESGDVCVNLIQETFNCHVGCKNNGFSLHLWRGTTAKRLLSGSSGAN